jgi:hypothetical protein
MRASSSSSRFAIAAESRASPEAADEPQRHDDRDGKQHAGQREHRERRHDQQHGREREREERDGENAEADEQAVDLGDHLGR